MPDSPELDRRGFLAAAAAATCACAFGCPFAAAGGDMPKKKGDDDDDDDDEETKGPPPVPVGKTDIGPLTDFTKDGVVDKWKDSAHFMVVHSGGKLYAVSAVCSHKATLVKIGTDGTIVCAKHSSRFGFNGVPIKGPAAKTGPLKRFAITTDAKGHVIVDTGKSFDEEETWKDPGASVKA